MLENFDLDNPSQGLEDSRRDGFCISGGCLESGGVDPKVQSPIQLRLRDLHVGLPLRIHLVLVLSTFRRQQHVIL